MMMYAIIGHHRQEADRRGHQGRGDVPAEKVPDTGHKEWDAIPSQDSQQAADAPYQVMITLIVMMMTIVI